MTQSTLRKKEIHRPPGAPYLRLVPVERTPEELLDLEFREEVVALTTPPGVERPRRLYKIAAGELVPLRVVARVIGDALMAEVDPHAIYAAIVRPLKRFIERAMKRQPPRLPSVPARKALPSA